MSLLKKIGAFFKKTKKEQDKFLKKNILFEDVILDIIVNVPHDLVSYKKYIKGLYSNFNLNLNKKERFLLVEPMMILTFDTNKMKQMRNYAIKKSELLSGSMLAYSVALNTGLPKSLYNNYFYSFLIRERYSDKYSNFYNKIYEHIEKKMLVVDNMKLLHMNPEDNKEDTFNLYWDMFSKKEQLQIIASKKDILEFRNLKVQKILLSDYKKKMSIVNGFEEEYPHDPLKFVLIIRRKNDKSLKGEFFIRKTHIKDLCRNTSKNKLFEEFCIKYNYTNFNEDTVNKFEEAYNRLKERKYLPLVDIEKE